MEPIPEPQHRISPSGTGISLRELPKPSFRRMIETCLHYESKGTGMYSSSALCGRYLFDLSRDIQQQAEILDKTFGKIIRTLSFRVRHLESVMGEWESTFGRPTSASKDEQLMTPRKLMGMLVQYDGRVTELESQNSHLKEKLNDLKVKYAQSLKGQYEVVSKEISSENSTSVSRCAAQLEEQRLLFEDEVSVIKQNAEKALKELELKKNEELEEYSGVVDDELRKKDDEICTVMSGMKEEQQKVISEVTQFVKEKEEQAEEKRKDITLKAEKDQRALVDEIDSSVSNFIRKMEKVLQRVKDPELLQSQLSVLDGFIQNLHSCRRRVCSEEEVTDNFKEIMKMMDNIREVRGLLSKAEQRSHAALLYYDGEKKVKEHLREARKGVPLRKIAVKPPPPPHESVNEFDERLNELFKRTRQNYHEARRRVLEQDMNVQ